MVHIYLLRHEQRAADISYLSSLTPEGLSNSKTKVLNDLTKLPIDEIYCSPFLRCLQTIQPYCETNNRKVNVEWYLAESIPNNYDYTDPSVSNIINTNYRSYDTSYPQLAGSRFKFDQLKERTHEFLKFLRLSHVQSDHILLVTHMPVINAIFYNSGYTQSSMFSSYSTGEISQLDDVINN